MDKLVPENSVPSRIFHPEREMGWPLENAAEAPARRLYPIRLAYLSFKMQNIS